MKLLGWKIDFSRGSKRKSSRIIKTKSSGVDRDVLHGAFADEINSVNLGIKAYREKTLEPSNSSSLLRRNVHRLEKALCFPVSKEIFAEDYIGETVEVLFRLINSQQFDGEEATWAFDVLERYFGAVGRGSQKVDSARLRFQQLIEIIDLREGARFPRKYGELGSVLSVDGQSFHELCRLRVSCRYFTGRAVELDRIELAIRSGSQAPSACNRQPFRYLWIRNAELKTQIVDLPFGTKGFGQQLPNLIMVVGDLSNFALPRDRHLIYIDASLATAQVMLSFTAQGLASVPINWPDVAENHQQARNLLGLNPYETPIMLLGFGYPDSEAMIPYSQKKPVSSLMTIYD